MYPAHVPPKPKPPASPRLTREEVFRAFSRDMDPEFARMVGFVKVGTR
jgi:hypothetical protein